ncbi:methionine ABC transporter (ATP-binding protein) [Clostridiaceae bacterium BL-3]|nr:methionine ABC transporter (ATP-binding protein) [Clostridiaceae bacterium BL-3]
MIEITNLQKSYGKTTILKDINLTINDNEIYGLVGRSGAGKSTLLRCINGLEKYDSGSLKVNGFDIKGHTNRELREFRKNIGMIFQNFSLMERKNVYENIALPMKCWGYKKKQIDKKVKELVKLVDIEDKLYQKPRSLSGGQKQRVAIARALSLDPKILLCDEATSALDPKTTKSILLLLKKINETLGIGMVVVTHQMFVVKKICHKVSILENGKICTSGTVSDVFLNQSKALKNLLGEDEEELINADGKSIKILYVQNSENNKLLSDIVKKFDVDFSITAAKLEKYRDAVLGSVVINVNEEKVADITNYLTKLKINWEVLNNEQ